jgi:hypothetical protein
MLGNGEVSWSMWTFHLQTFYDSLSVLFIQNWNSICTWIPSTFHFHMCFHMCCDIFYFVNISFPFFYRNSMMKNGLTCPLAIWWKLCITSGCSTWENVALVYTQQRLMTTFMFSNNLHCINNTYKVVHLVMVLVGLNCCWRGLKGWMILLDLLQQWQITHPDHASQIAYCTSKEFFFWGLPSNLLIVLLALTMIPIILTMWISLIHE